MKKAIKLTHAKALEQLEEIRELVNRFSEPEEYDPDFDAQSASGGNFDDCYNMGRDLGHTEGEADLAATIRDILDT